MLATTGDITIMFPGSTVDTPRATMLIEIATAVIQAVTEQRIVQVVNDIVTIDLDDYDDQHFLYLPEWPVTAVGTVTIGATAVTDHVTQLSRGRIWRAGGWRSTMIRYADQPSTATVQNTHGYAAGNQRLQLARGAVLAMVRDVVDNPTGTVTSEKIDDYAVTYARMSGFLEGSKFLLEALRRQYSRPPAGSVRLVAR
jgi:hypothetical protein